MSRGSEKEQEFPTRARSNNPRFPRGASNRPTSTTMLTHRLTAPQGDRGRPRHAPPHPARRREIRAPFSTSTEDGEASPGTVDSSTVSAYRVRCLIEESARAVRLPGWGTRIRALRRVRRHALCRRAPSRACAGGQYGSRRHEHYRSDLCCYRRGVGRGANHHDAQTFWSSHPAPLERHVRICGTVPDSQKQSPSQRCVVNGVNGVSRLLAGIQCDHVGVGYRR